MSNNGASQSKWNNIAIITGLITAIATLIGEIGGLINVIPHFPSAENSHPAFQVSYLYRQAGQANFQKITDSSELHSGDYYKIWFTPEEDSYVYIFQLDSSGTIHRLFPMESFKGVAVNHSNPVKAGRQYQLPAANMSFQLDNQVGQESFFFLAFREPNTILERQYQALQQAHRQQQSERITDLRAMLLETLRKGGPTEVSRVTFLHLP